MAVIDRMPCTITIYTWSGAVIIVKQDMAFANLAWFTTPEVLKMSFCHCRPVETNSYVDILGSERYAFTNHWKNAHMKWVSIPVYYPWSLENVFSCPSNLVETDSCVGSGSERYAFKNHCKSALVNWVDIFRNTNNMLMAPGIPRRSPIQVLTGPYFV